MKNTKMKYKIFFLMMLLVISLNNGMCEINEGEISSYVLENTDHDWIHNSGALLECNGLYVHNGEFVDGLQSVHTYLDASIWQGSTSAYGKGDIVYEYPIGTPIDTGYLYFWQMNTDDDPEYEIVYVKAYLDNGLPNLSSSEHIIYMNGTITSHIKTDSSYKLDTGISTLDDKACGLGHRYSSTRVYAFTGEHTSRIFKTFYNKYYYWYNQEDEILEFNISRDDANKSKIKIINNGDIELINETTLLNTNIKVLSEDLNNDTWFFYATDHNGISHQRTFDFIPDIEDLTPTLTTDKFLYNTSEQITISFTNIDEIEGYVGEGLSLYILYPVIHESKDYDAKYMLHLLGDRRDETFTLNTSFLTPQNEYHLAICVDGDFHNIDDAIIISDTFFVYDDNEYLTSSCNPEGNCYTYNNNDITIYYRINNNSDIIIKDNDGTTIQTYYNIIDEGEINYHIPNDENKLNSYPDWKIYLNNTEYSTSYNTNVTVYWSLFATPTPTPVYTIDIPDENVTEQIDQLKEESKSIFDLIYGLTTLVIDNPDYDNDNIVDEYEINNWFNSLIPLGILLLLIILYMGLKKRD